MLHLLQLVAVTSLQGALSISDLPAFLDGLPETLSPAAGVLMFYQHLMVLSLSLFKCRRWCACHEFDSICRKNVQQLYLQINLLKTRLKDLSNDINYVS